VNAYLCVESSCMSGLGCRLPQSHNQTVLSSQDGLCHGDGLEKVPDKNNNPQVSVERGKGMRESLTSAIFRDSPVVPVTALAKAVLVEGAESR